MDDKTDETYPLKQIGKEDGDENEKAPLQNEKNLEENDKGDVPNGKDGDHDKAPLLSLVSSPLIKLLIVSIIASLFIAFIALLIIFALAGSDDDAWSDSISLMHIIPNGNTSKNLISFSYIVNPNYKPLTKAMDEFLQQYNKSVINDETKNVTNCSITPPTPKQVCFYDIDQILKNCIPEEDYGFSIGTPCIFAVFNKAYNWTPERYDKEDLNSTNLSEEVKNAFKNPETSLFFQCEGLSNVDKENIQNISYYPSQEISGIYFPFKGQPDYLSPFVAMKFKIADNVRISVACKLYGKNINIDEGTGSDPSGILRFNLFKG